MAEFVTELRRLMAERGVSVRELARRAHYDNGHLSKVLNGHKAVTRDLGERIDDVLGTEGALTALTAPPLFDGASLGPGDGDRLGQAARQPRRLDSTVIRSLADVLAAQRRAEDALGSAALLKPVTAQLHVVEEMVREASVPLRLELLNTAQQWAQFAAWLHASIGDRVKANARFSQTLEWATEAGDATMAATVLSYKGYLAWHAGEIGPMIGLAQAAQRDKTVAVSQLAYAAGLEARGHALADCANTQSVERKLDHMVELAAQLPGHPEQQRPWAYWYTPAFFDCQRGITYGYLSHDPRYRQLALDALTAGYHDLGPDGQASEWGAAYLVRLASIHARGGDVGPACADATRAALIARQTGSAALAAMLRRLHARLTAQWPSEPCVNVLAAALH